MGEALTKRDVLTNDLGKTLDPVSSTGWNSGIVKSLTLIVYSAGYDGRNCLVPISILARKDKTAEVGYSHST